MFWCVWITAVDSVRTKTKVKFCMINSILESKNTEDNIQQ